MIKDMTLKELRASKNLTQQEVAILVGISLRSYKQYENDASKVLMFTHFSNPLFIVTGISISLPLQTTLVTVSIVLFPYIPTPITLVELK